MKREVREAFDREVFSVLLQREIGRIKVKTPFALPSIQSTYRGICMVVDDLNLLPGLFVITILNFVPFGYDYMMYTIQNHCVEMNDLDYLYGNTARQIMPQTIQYGLSITMLVE